MWIKRIVDLFLSSNKQIKIKDLRNVSGPNMNLYSIDINLNGNKQDVETTEKDAIHYIKNKYDIITDLELKEIKDVPGNNISIVIHSDDSLDLISKLELKHKLQEILKENKSIKDININEVCIQ